MSQMDETRKDLADKLEKLEEKVTGTVASVTDLVEKVPETVETVKDTIAETVNTVSDTVQDTVQAVKGTVKDTVGAVTGTVRNLFNIPRHVDRHPWLMMGGSVLLGFLGGRLVLPRREAEALPPSSSGQPAAPPPAPPYHAPAAPPAPAFEPARYQGQPHEGESGQEESREGWLSRLGDKFGDEIHKVKGLALGTLLGVARDMISQWVPETLRNDVTSVINNFTADLGGKVFDKPILGGNGYPAQGGDGASSQQGDSHEGSEEPEPQTAAAATATTARRGNRGKR